MAEQNDISFLHLQTSACSAYLTIQMLNQGETIIEPFVIYTTAQQPSISSKLTQQTIMSEHRKGSLRDQRLSLLFKQTIDDQVQQHTLR